MRQRVTSLSWNWLGQTCLKQRISFMVDLGVQFMGKMKVYDNKGPVDLDELVGSDDDWQKWDGYAHRLSGVEIHALRTYLLIG